jgi:hypothetical protein
VQQEVHPCTNEVANQFADCLPNRVTDRQPHRIPDAVPDAVSDAVSDAIPDRLPDRVSHQGSDRGPNQGPDQGPDRRADACPYSGTNSDADTKPHACSSLLLQLENDEVRARRHETSACLGGVQQGVPARDVWRVQRSHWPVQGVRVPPDHLQH